MIINILEYLENSQLKFPDKDVFCEENKNITYAQLLDSAKRIGTYILNQTNGARKKPVVVFVDRNLESLIMFAGVAYSNNFYVPIDKQMPKLRIELILNSLNPVAAIALESEVEYAKENAPGLLTLIYENCLRSEIDGQKLKQIRKEAIDTDPVYATFTSGSTGVPKGVITCHRSVIDLTEALTDTFNFDSNHVFGNQNPFYFDASIKDIYCTLKCGATMYIIPKSCFLYPETLIDYLNKSRIDSILWSASAIAHLANTQAFDAKVPEFLKKVMFSGEVMHNRVLNYWRKALPSTSFVNLYGPTEITSVCTYYKVEKDFTDDEALPIGAPFRNTGILILNEANQQVDGVEIGEICVRGCCLALGYYNNPVKTSEVFCQNPLNENYPETIYRTGDLGKYDNDGQIIFLSRKDNQVKHMGQRVELGEIEIIVNSLRGVNCCVCFYDHKNQKIILLYQGNSEVDKKFILAGIKDILPKYMYPNQLIKMDDMPLNVNGKIDRSLLKTKYQNGELA